MEKTDGVVPPENPDEVEVAEVLTANWLEVVELTIPGFTSLSDKGPESEFPYSILTGGIPYSSGVERKNLLVE